LANPCSWPIDPRLAFINEELAMSVRRRQERDPKTGALYEKCGLCTSDLDIQTAGAPR
jgi:hypothetical protein